MRNFFRYWRLFFWFLSEFIKRYIAFIFFGFIAGFLIFFLIIKFSPFIISQFNFSIKKIGIIGNYSPTTLPLSIQQLISLGLTSQNEKGEAIPSIAWKWEIKDDGRVYIFYLKNDLSWHDGTKFTSYDVNYNFRDVQIEPINEEILKITLKKPFAPLPTILSRPLFKKALIGLGPYKVKKIKLKGGSIQSLSLFPLIKEFPLLEFKFYPNENTAITAFKLGEVDIIEKVNQPEGFLNWSNVKISPKVYFNYNVALFFNCRNPILQKKAVRQALAYAIPDLENEENKSLGPFNPNSWAYNSDVKIFSFNPELARSLLSKEGIATSTAMFKFSTFPSFLPLASKIASSWENFGIKTEIRVENSLPTDFDILLVSQEIPADPDQYHLWHSTQSTNLTGFANVRIDKLLEDGRTTIDKEKRIKIYHDFQKYLVDEAPAVFLFHPKLYTIERK